MTTVYSIFGAIPSLKHSLVEGYGEGNSVVSEDLIHSFTVCINILARGFRF